MSRSVSTPSGAAVVVFAAMDTTASHDEQGQYDEEGMQFEWDNCIDNLRDSLTARYPSLSKCDRWLGREDHGILSNRHATVTVSEYCGLVAVCLVPTDEPMAGHWCEQIEPGFRKVVGEVFGGTLRKVATASNGEAFFEQVAA